MTYRDHIVEAMRMLTTDPDVYVVGYNTRYGGQGGGTFSCFPEERLLEMPLAENLMAGAAIGLSIGGQIPVLWFERADFVLCAMDALVNHLDKLADLSGGFHRPGVIIRIVVGNSQAPLFTGPTHTQDVSTALSALVKFPVVVLRDKDEIIPNYQVAWGRAKGGQSTALVEFKDNYGK